MKAALALDIPFLFLDLEKEYKEGVVDKMLAEYKAGRTPNPDVLCNREIKFGSFWQFAQAHGADFIATGHYARIEREFSISNSQFPINELVSNENSNIENSMKIANCKLETGLDAEKDQSYFLWTLTEKDLEHTLFPVGGMEKSDVRKLARKFKLPVAEKKDSQGICFMGSISMEEFLSHFIEAKPGMVLDTDGEEIGSHRGLVHYTVGERHGFEVTKKGISSGPFYVVSKDETRNALIVSDKEEEIKELSPTKIILKDMNWRGKRGEMKITARIRYRGEKLPCILKKEGNEWQVEFREPVRGLSLGQSVVFYENEICRGGAVMDKIVK